MINSHHQPAIRRLVDAEQIFPLINELLKIDKTIRLKVRGNSMWPFMRSDRDDIILEQAVFDAIKKGDIVLIQRRDGAYILHRVWKVSKDAFYMIGDAQQFIEGPLYPDQLMAKGVAIIRKGRELSCDAWRMRLAVWIWLQARPFRSLLIGAYRKLRRMLR